jgi:hypothetical protein
MVLKAYFIAIAALGVGLTAVVHAGADPVGDSQLTTAEAAGALETGGPVISEFCADNADTLEDENADTSDWIEIYNGQAAAVNLSGWHLTNDPGNRTQWALPDLTLPGYGYLIVYASAKNRNSPTLPLHTNFTLQREAGYLALVKPGGTVLASEFAYGAQAEDISYGLLPEEAGFTYGYLETPTPGASNTGLQEPGPPAEEIVFLKDNQPVTGGLLSTDFFLTLASPVAPGSTIRYTLDNTIPTAASTAYSAPIPITATTTVRARVFSPGLLPGPVSSRTFLPLDASLTDYHGSGRPFSSNLPLIVLDSFGVAVDASSDPTQERPFRLTYAVIIDEDPASPAPNTQRAVITGPADFQGRSGTHVRGESSAEYPQKSYAWELWDNEDQDKDASILGLPADSDWVLHAPYSDKTLMRNYLVYDRMRALNGQAAAMGVRFVEVFFNQDGGPLGEEDYRGVYVLVEKIKRGKDRVDIEKLNSLMADPDVISGGYIFKKDKRGVDDTNFNTSTFFQSFQFVEPETPNPAQLSWLTRHLNDFESVLAAPNFAHPVNGYAAFIDPSSFIENQWFVEMTKQLDGYVISTYFYKNRAGKIHCAPIWDYNLSLYNGGGTIDGGHSGWYYPILQSPQAGYWGRLHHDEKYKIRHWDRYWDLRSGSFATETILSDIDRIATELVNGSAIIVTNGMPDQPPQAENPAMRHYRKWPILGTYVFANPGDPTLRTKFWNGPSQETQPYATADAEVDAMKDFLRQRLAWIDDQNTVGSLIYRPPVFSSMGGRVPVGSTVSITRHTGTAPAGHAYATGGTLYYTLDGSDPRPESGHAAEHFLIDGIANACHYLVPTTSNGGLALTAATGSQQWTGVTSPPNAAQWSSRLTGVGYEQRFLDGTNFTHLIGAGSNTASAMYNKNPTCYLRVPFIVPDQATLDSAESLHLYMRYDDGFRAYINGVEVAGRNDTHSSVTTSPGTARASEGRPDTEAIEFEWIDITEAGLAALQVGDNVLAIHGLNEAANSDDFLILPKLSYRTAGEASTGQVYTGPITLTQSTQVRARLYANNYWSPITTANFIVGAAPASAANLVISELCYQPLPPAPGTPEYETGFTAGNNFEYIEILNISASPVDLTGCQLSSGVTFDFAAVAPEKLTLLPGQRALIVENEAAFLLRYGSGLAPQILGVYSGNLSNSGETVTLLAADTSVIASVTYGIADPWPTAASELGYSLVLNSPKPNPSYNPLDFRSGAQAGGTPGAPAGAPFADDPMADIDADGFRDVLEYAMGTNRTDPSSAAIPTSIWQEFTVNGLTRPYLTFSYRRNDAAEGVSWHVELSTALDAWSSDPGAVTYVGTVANGDGTSTVTWRATQAVDDPSRQLMRLRVTQP